MSFKSGFVGIVGRPNVGKSTLMTSIIGQKISIVSDKPQTTRNRIMGVWHRPESQVVFLDTPGVHRGKYAINDYMLQTAFSVLTEVDLILLLVEYWETGGDEFSLLMSQLRQQPQLPPVMLVINKIDLGKKQDILEAVAHHKDLFAFEHIIPVSALQGENLDTLQELILQYMEEGGPRYFPEDMITDQSERFVVAEFIREKVFQLTGQEIPHCVAVTVEEFITEERRICIDASIHVERSSQKGMIIGKGGSMIKEIGTLARKDLEIMLGMPVFLELRVKVARDWRKTNSRLRQFGYSEPT
ncbi:GTPase Era [Desulfurispira natronophila]|uniref:GTPase Era n=1 Tax=Desulfurispira natronophila TaxID=682562 RepID=A0A7W8DGU0_9BACT|nr:GTPase Era [Desulfurispira natronophila]MBB5021707.1 GTP-binding protein Era [Desulfurispira natronophila]